MGWALLAASLCGLQAGRAQANGPVAEKAGAEPAVAPGVLYKQAMHPLDVVRASIENWSDSETAAFAVGVRMAKAGCDEAPAENYAGDDLFDLARLCSLGQDWNAANTAATRYLDGRAEPHRTEAFAVSINALMHLNGADLAVATANTMIENQPYDAEAAYALRYLKDALEQAGNPAALVLAQAEHPQIVKALGAGGALKAVHGDSVISMGVLYESAMELAFWQRYHHDDSSAAATVKDIDDAMAKATAAPAEDKARMDAVRTQYALLGEPLPVLKTTPAAGPPKTRGKTGGAGPDVHVGPDYGTATVLVLFPDWCPQCRRMMKTLTAFGAANKDTPVYVYGLMFLDDPGVPDMTADQKEAAHEQNIRDVTGTSTLLVDADAVQVFGALEFPLGIVVDHEGKVRYVGALPGDAFAGNGYVETVLTRMAGGEGKMPGAK